MIFEQMRLDFEIIKPVETKERLFKNPYKTVFHNSLIKAKNVYNHAIIRGLNYKNGLIACFDNIVYSGGRYSGKPDNIIMVRDFLTIKKFNYKNL